jgi:flap endonuclease-1
MGVNIKDILIRKPISLDELQNKILIVDGYNMLYQFLTTIRGRDGSPFTDSHGNVTSHLIGLFSRTTNFMNRGIKLAFCFDGKVPDLKHKELQRRAEVKAEAKRLYEEALEKEDVDQMQKYAGRTAKLTKPMVDQAKALLDGLGIPWVQAPSEGEAQAAHMVKKGDGWAVVSQDFDSLLYATPRLIQNLSIEGRRKIPGKLAFTTVEPLLIDLKENLAHLELTQEQLINLAVLVGTDYAPSGVRGIGPKKGLALVKELKDAEKIFEGKKFEDEVDWKEIINVFKTMPVTDDYELKWGKPNKEAVTKLLVEQHDFSQERIDKFFANFSPPKQKGLGDFG